jgi:SAM-dependent methyltransferase
MRAIHPFPARMAPETVAQWLEGLPSGSRVLDPMCGSGVVLRHSVQMGHKALGYDVDPLAVLMSRVWTRKGKHSALNEYAQEIVKSARRRRTNHLCLPWIARCSETRGFIEYWFCEPQRSEVSRLVAAIEAKSHCLPGWAIDALYLTLSRIVVTKQAGASLAWDTSHSRPHRKIVNNEFDTFGGFLRSAGRLAAILDQAPIEASAVVRNGDCRNLPNLPDASIDAIVTSPPYLNAIDYLRGHKLSLVWMGHTIPSLRDVRADAIGTERVGRVGPMRKNYLPGLEDTVASIRRLPGRQRAIVHRYANDANRMLAEMRRVVTDRGRLVFVLADSCLRGVGVSNSEVFAWLAEKNKFTLIAEERRDIPHGRRYLPINTDSLSLSKRMKRETVQLYRPVN